MEIRIISVVRSASAAFTAALFFFAAVTVSAQTANLAERAATLDSGSVEEKREALYQLRINGTAEAARLAVRTLGDPVPSVRAEAASTAAQLPPEEAATALVPLLSDKVSFVRKEAALALGRARARDAAESLVRVFEEDSKKDVRAAAATALGWIGATAAVPALIRGFARNTGSKDAFLRREAAAAIGRIAESTRGTAASRSIPESFLPQKFKTSDPGGPGDLAASDTAFAQASSVLASALLNPKESNEVKRNSAYALGAIGSIAAGDALRGCSISDDIILAETCREAFAKLGQAD